MNFRFSVQYSPSMQRRISQSPSVPLLLNFCKNRLRKYNYVYLALQDVVDWLRNPVSTTKR